MSSQHHTRLVLARFSTHLTIDGISATIRYKAPDPFKLPLIGIDFIEEQAQTIEEAIQLACENRQAESPCAGLPADCHYVIETIPAVGTAMTAATIGKVEDIGRFADARRFVAYAGLDAPSKVWAVYRSRRTAHRAW